MTLAKQRISIIVPSCRSLSRCFLITVVPRSRNSIAIKDDNGLETESLIVPRKTLFLYPIKWCIRGSAVAAAFAAAFAHGILDRVIVLRWNIFWTSLSRAFPTKRTERSFLRSSIKNWTSSNVGRYSVGVNRTYAHGTYVWPWCIFGKRERERDAMADANGVERYTFATKREEEEGCIVPILIGLHGPLKSEVRSFKRG